MSVKLGEKVKNEKEDFEGLVITRSEYLAGSVSGYPDGYVQCEVVRTNSKEARWFNEEELRVK